MKRILFALMTVAIVAGLVAGGTVAHFSDQEITGAGFTAGTLDLKPDDENIDPYIIADMNPCKWYKDDFWVRNNGNKDGTLTLHLRDLVQGNGTDTEPELELVQELGLTENPYNISTQIDVIIIYCHYENVLHVVEGAASWQEAVGMLLDYDPGIGEHIKAAGKLIDLICEDILLQVVMKQYETVLFQMLVHLEQPDDINLYQGDTCQFNRVFNLVELQW